MSGIKIMIDVDQFKPSEIFIEAIEPNTITIQDDIGLISREILREYIFHQGSTSDHSELLIIKVPAPIVKQSPEKIIPIEKIAAPNTTSRSSI
jgi:hypothetical protein